MIRLARQWLACRRLNKLVARQRKLNSGYLERQERLEYERRILAAEVETVRIAKRARRFAELIQRNTQTLDAALTVANCDADKRGYDRLTVEPWVPRLLSLLDDIQELIGDDNQNRLLSEKQPKSVDSASAGEAGTATTAKHGVVHEHAASEAGDAR